MSRRWCAILCFILGLLVFAPIAAQVGIPAEDLADPDGRFLELYGVQTYFIERGVHGDPAVVLLHGFGGSTFTWRDNIDALTEAGYYVIAYDRPPFGLSDKRIDIDRSASAMVEQAITLVDALDIESAIWVGHSAGGDIIARLAMEHPDRVSGLVFVAAALRDNEHGAQEDPGNDGGGENGSPMGGISEFVSAMDPESPLAQNLVRNFLTPERFMDMLASAYHPSYYLTDEVAQGYQRVLRVEGWEAAFITLFADQDEPEPIDVGLLALVEIPVLVIWGEEDAWVPIETGQRLHDLIPESHWKSYPDVGHLPMEENSVQFNEDLLGFLTLVDWN